AANVLDLQTKWAATGAAAVTGYVQNGQITINNTTAVSVPITAPAGTTITGATLDSYGGELSGWLTPGTTTGTLPAAVLTISGSRAFVVGKVGTVNIAATGTPTPTISLAGTLPAGVTFTASPGGGVITGAPAAGTVGSYPLTITSVSGASTQTRQITITVSQAPTFISAAAATAQAGVAFDFAITTTGYPAARVTRT